MNLYVFGCSASDRTEVPKCYGDYLADSLNLTYQHYAAGCGSNDRIFRNLLTLVKNKTITSKDLVIIQYTETTRTEYWSSFVNDVNLRDNYDSGQILRYKINSGSWQPNKIEKKFFKLYEQYFLNETFEQEKFAAHNFALQCVLEKYNIDAWFLDIHGYLPLSFDTIEYFKDRIISLPDPKIHQLFFDDGHFHIEGHKKVAKIIQKRLTTNSNSSIL